MERNKITLALIAGGSSSEREVSLNGANQVQEALDKERYDILRYDPAFDIGRLVSDSGQIDAAFILLHGRYGEDGTVQGLLDLLGIPYQCSGVLGSALAMDKALSRILYAQAGLNVPKGEVVGAEMSWNVEDLVDRLGMPLVIKPVDQGSSIGMSIAGTTQDAKAGLSEAFKHSSRVLVEEYIRGTEITAGIIGNDDLMSLPIVEIVPGDGYDFFDYEAKYKPGATLEICPARIDYSLAETAQKYAIIAHKTLQLIGYSRSDMIIREGTIYILETNTIPGMTRTSLLPLAAKQAGMDFPELLDRLISLSLERKQKFK